MTLHQLCQDKTLIKELKDYFLNVLREKAIEKVFETGEAKEIKQAKEVIEEAFENIEVQFTQKEKPKDVLNEAR